MAPTRVETRRKKRLKKYKAYANKRFQKDMSEDYKLEMEGKNIPRTTENSFLCKTARAITITSRR